MSCGRRRSQLCEDARGLRRLKLWNSDRTGPDSQHDMIRDSQNGISKTEIMETDRTGPTTKTSFNTKQRTRRITYVVV